jgi:hypothetical protein
MGAVQRDEHADLRQSGGDDRSRDVHPFAIEAMRSGDDDFAWHGGTHLFNHWRAAHDAGCAEVAILKSGLRRIVLHDN